MAQIRVNTRVLEQLERTKRDVGAKSYNDLFEKMVDERAVSKIIQGNLSPRDRREIRNVLRGSR